MRLGGWGLLLLGILDSSYLFAPWGNDLLVVAMTVRNPNVAHMLYYAFMSTAGSVLGCLLIDVTLRPLGAKGLERHLSPRVLKRVQGRVKDNVGKTIAVTSLIPPPFPFTAFLMAASALQYPRKKLFPIVALSRMVRFTLLGWLALRFGERIVGWSKLPWVQGVLIGVIVICLVGSVWSVYGWIKRSRAGAGKEREPATVSG